MTAGRTNLHQLYQCVWVNISASALNMNALIVLKKKKKKKINVISEDFKKDTT